MDQRQQWKVADRLRCKLMEALSVFSGAESGWKVADGERFWNAENRIKTG